MTMILRAIEQLNDQIKLIVAPTDAPSSIETTMILRAIEQLNDRVSGLSR
jgi:hypothetical protein